MVTIKKLVAITILWLIPGLAWASDRLSITDYAPPGTTVDRTGTTDDSLALANVIAAANLVTARAAPPAFFFRQASTELCLHRHLS